LREQVPVLINLLWRASATMLLALLFSFLITLDIARLSEELQSLRASRLNAFYEQAAQPVIRFAYVFGRSFQAQSAIACLTAILTMIGMVLLGIPSVAMLALIVFVCSFIPVLGVFISTVPIMLVALNSSGMKGAISAVVLVLIIHTIQAYLLNPIIYGKHLKLNPVLVLIILFVGHHAFGVWGMLLGVPVAYYFIHDVFGVPVWSERVVSPLPAKPLGSMTQTNEDGEAGKNTMARTKKDVKATSMKASSKE
jgi:predicted PurR-regulated permease PerM